MPILRKVQFCLTEDVQIKKLRSGIIYHLGRSQNNRTKAANMKENYSLASSLRDNHQRGTVGEYLAEHVVKDSLLGCTIISRHIKTHEIEFDRS